MKKRRLFSIRRVAAAAAVAAVVLPFTFVRFPPMTDLPQHVLQVRLFLETVSQPSGEYMVQWFSPYGLSYLAIGVGWALAGPEEAGRIGAALIAALWVGGLQWLAAVRGRPLGAALLASTLSGFVLSWGYLPFLGGFPLYVWWLHRTEAGEREPSRITSWPEIGLLTTLATALYLTHAQWYAMAAVTLLLTGLRLPWRQQIVRGLALVPAGLLALAWLSLARARGFERGTRWLTEPLERLRPEELVSAAPGGPRGLGREIVLAAVVLWIGLGILSWLRARREVAAEASPARADRRLLAAGGLMLVVALCTPEVPGLNALWSAKRWWAPGLALVLLGLMPPLSRWGVRRTAVVATVAAALVVGQWTAVNVYAWRWFERVELAGLAESLDALPPDSRLLGLDYVRRSLLFDGEPFLQQFAYGPAWKRGTANFSFARFAPLPVIYRDHLPVPWTGNLEWLPRNVRRSDFAYFDYVLVNGERDLLEEFPRRAPIVPVTTTEPWRLYRVVPPSLP